MVFPHTKSREVSISCKGVRLRMLVYFRAAADRARRWFGNEALECKSTIKQQETREGGVRKTFMRSRSVEHQRAEKTANELH